MSKLDEIAPKVSEVITNGCLARRQRMDLYEELTDLMTAFRTEPVYERAILSKPFRTLWKAMEQGLGDAFVKVQELDEDEPREE
jgi:hypothetical protein